MPSEVQLPAEPPAAAARASVGCPGGRCMGRDPLSTSDPVAGRMWKRLRRQMLDLAVGWWRLLERLPKRLPAMVSVEDKADDPEHQPAEVDERRVGDVLEHQLREHGPDRNSADHRQDGNAVAA